jgi:hypothetical protein
MSSRGQGVVYVAHLFVMLMLASGTRALVGGRAMPALSRISTRFASVRGKTIFLPSVLANIV